MCVGVALSVAVFGAVGAGDVHGICKVTDNIGVGVFVYGDARRGVRAENNANALLNAALGNKIFHITGDLYKAFFWC